MVVCIVGEVVSISGRTFDIKDRITSEVFSCKVEGEDSLDLKVGDTGCFVGTSYNNSIKVHKIEIRKFLDPLYEDDLLDLSSKHTLLPIIDEPFTQIYKEFLERNEPFKETS
jgi:hypothetical protein